MNEGKFIAIQNYLEEIAGQNKQIIGQLQRTNELLAKSTAPTANEGLRRLCDQYDAVMEGKPVAVRVGDATVMLTPPLLTAEIIDSDAPMLGTLETEPPPAAQGTTVTRDMGNIGPIWADTGEPVNKPKATPKKGK